MGLFGFSVFLAAGLLSCTPVSLLGQQRCLSLLRVRPTPFDASS
jgi:hypothetical protein